MSNKKENEEQYNQHLRDKFSTLDTNKLRHIVSCDANQYTPEAIEIAKAELTKRDSAVQELSEEINREDRMDADRDMIPLPLETECDIPGQNFARDLQKIGDEQLQNYFESSELFSSNEIKLIMNEMRRRELPLTFAKKGKGIKLFSNSREFENFYSIPDHSETRIGVGYQETKIILDYSKAMAHRIEMTESKQKQVTGCLSVFAIVLALTAVLDFLILIPNGSKFSIGSFLIHFLIIGIVASMIWAVPYDEYKKRKKRIEQVIKDRIANGESDAESIKFKLISDGEWNSYCISKHKNPSKAKENGS